MKKATFQIKGTLKELNFSKFHVLLLVGFLIPMVTILSNCTDPEKKDIGNKIQISPPDSIRQNFSLIADTINYGVVVHNRDSSNRWLEKSLSGFERKDFIKRIFQAIYDKEIQPYDYFTGEALSVRDIKKLEKDPEFKRSRIGKIQFLERWYIDTTSLSMVKKVHSIMFAYEIYREDGTFRGYKPAFKVFLPKDKK